MLEAPELSGHAETWIVQATPMWNLRYSGVPAVYVEGEDWSHEFHPLPGEKLELDIDRPEAVKGTTLAIDGQHSGRDRASLPHVWPARFHVL